jgi:hypothetical protein
MLGVALHDVHRFHGPRQRHVERVHEEFVHLE